MTGKEKALSVAREYLATHITNSMSDVHQFDQGITIGWADGESLYYFRRGTETSWGGAKDIIPWLDALEDQLIICMFCSVFRDWDLNTFEIFEEVINRVKDWRV